MGGGGARQGRSVRGMRQGVDGPMGSWAPVWLVDGLWGLGGGEGWGGVAPSLMVDGCLCLARAAICRVLGLCVWDPLDHPERGI